MKPSVFYSIAGAMFFYLVILSSCVAATEESTSARTEDPLMPTPASTMPELISNLSSDDPEVRIVSMHAIEEYGSKAEPAIPKLIANLHYEDSSDVRMSAIHALGQLGPAAKEAVPDLEIILQEDQYYQARASAALALGQIGDSSAVPTLASTLFEENSQPFDVSIFCAKAIAKITGERFTDSESLAYTLNEDGIPLIVIDARKWWEERGKYQDWSEK